MMAFGLYAAACVLAVALIGAVAWGMTGPAAHPVLGVGAAIAVVVQLVAFAIARQLRVKNLMLGWGLGSALRFAALVIYTVVVARLWRAALTPALLSFVAFLFVTTVIEPIFLRYR